MMGASAVSSGAIRWFPGDYFDSRVKSVFQSEVMESWPGPSQLMALWREGGLDEPAQVSLLLGGAVFHDPVLLPAYREAVLSPSQRVRQAAVYGYRDLLGDSLPRVSGGVSEEDAALLGEEMDWVMRTLAEASLFEMWMQALLVHEDTGLSGWHGVTLQRTPGACSQALDRLVGVEDLPLLLQAYDITRDFSIRVNLLKLVEAVTLSRFIIMPTDEKAGWGRHVFTTAMDALEGARRGWPRDGCTVNGEAVLSQNLRTMGVSGLDPLSSDGCGVWLGILDRGFPQWWMLSSRQLYACGGPWVEMSALAPERDPGPEQRKMLLQWFRPLMPGGAGPNSAAVTDYRRSAVQ
ncbi:MAG: hypothetical protein E4H44_01100 [Candidatus Aminicenantes bacterium]|nr:MAG: hypothetical protein E4H44_01100 [Candidatus Aminicenantes bacterium]